MPEEHHPNPLPDLLVTNQVVGPLMVQLLDSLEESGTRCAALTGWVEAGAGEQTRFEVIPAVRLRKRPAWKRLLSWGAFTLQAAWQLIRRRRSPALIVSNPPTTALLAPLIRRLTGRRYALLVYDIYPELMERMGLVREGGPIARFWRGMHRRAMRRADGVVTIGSRMADTLRAQLREGDEVDIAVLPNWADTDFVRPIPKSDNAFAREHGLVGKLVVSYSGAFGATHDVDSIIASAEMLTDLDEVHFLLIGGGTREAEVRELVAEKGLPNLTLLPLQPWETVPLSFAAADVAIVCLDEAYRGLSVPSKTYYTLSAGAATLAISPPDTELTDLVVDEQCGWHVAPRDPAGIAKVVRAACADRESLGRKQANARRAAEERYSRDVMVGRWIDWLGGTLGQSVGPATCCGRND
ncbi:MAG: glycosyltransferase family 4 protein [Planctomycetota bacterium]